MPTVTGRDREGGSVQVLKAVVANVVVDVAVARTLAGAGVDQTILATR